MTSRTGFQPLIHEAVAQRATRDPDATALVWRDREISYGGLETAANDYAVDLSDLGVGPRQIVPLLVDRSPELVALQLGVLKTGAAYANLDSHWPAQRLQMILDLVAPVVVVTTHESTHTHEQLDGNFACYQPPIDGIAGAARRARPFDPAAVRPDAPAVVFFTSGTTGTPKGVVSPHRAVTRLFGSQGLSGFGPGHATPQVAALPWDMCAFELWGQLTTGGTVVLLADNYLLPSSLRRAVSIHDVDTLWITTSVFNLFVDEDPDCFAGLAIIYTGGEKVSPEHMRSFLRRHPGLPVRNGYGPAESCMIATVREVVPADCDVPGGIPIGVPAPGTSVELLNADDQRCEPGEEGEICVAGLGLATGYLGQPELTLEKFPTIDLDGIPVRIYRTGDMGVWDHGGVLHYRGRRDRQIKISGQRIELAEIESVADSLPGVRNCVVFPINNSDGIPERLALVYVMPTGPLKSRAIQNKQERVDQLAEPPAPVAGRHLGSPPGQANAAGAHDGDPLNVQARLRRLLPGYMVPQVVRSLSQYPVTANGKVDHSALREIVRQPRPAAPDRTAAHQ